VKAAHFLNMNLYVWGSNKSNQISSKKELHIYSPTLNLDFENLSSCQVATGDSHTLILTDYGDVYSMGRGKEGMLGLGTKTNETHPKLISALSNETIVSVQCGALTSYAVTSSGRVYHW
jgi:alpha-tubulin suppressor-like RCC1 family protein